MSKTILIVEDDADIRAAVAELLETEGYTVVVADNGLVGLEALARGEKPHLVLLDLMMPILDGYGFLERLRADPVTRAIPVVVLTASQSTPPPGVNGFLRKPFELDALFATVAKFLGP